MSDATAKEMADRLQRISTRVQRVSGNWMCTCPAHDDSSPSLSVKWSGGRLLYHCFGGCTFADVASQIRRMGYDPVTGDRLRDRGGNDMPAKPLKALKPSSAVVDEDEMERRFLAQYVYDPHTNPNWVEDPKAFEEDSRATKTTRYVYRNVFGHPMMTVTRLERPNEEGKIKKVMFAVSPWRDTKTGRIELPGRTMPEPRLPYGMDRISVPGPLFSVEGEKCADRLYGLLQQKFGVFSVYGSTPEHADFTDVRDRTVINITDIDKPGRAYRERITSCLGASVIHVASPWRGPTNQRPPKGWDIADEVDGKGGLVTPITTTEFISHLSRQLRQIVRPDHDEAMKAAIKALKVAFA